MAAPQGGGCPPEGLQDADDALEDGCVVTIAEIAQVCVRVAVSNWVRERIEVTMTPNKVTVAAYDPARSRRGSGGCVKEVGRFHEHKVTVEVRHGILRVLWINPYGDRPTKTETVPLDDADDVIVGMLTRALLVARDPF